MNDQELVPRGDKLLDYGAADKPCPTKDHDVYERKPRRFPLIARSAAPTGLLTFPGIR